jgi:ketosteroid isomerase-like protein
MVTHRLIATALLSFVALLALGACSQPAATVQQAVESPAAEEAKVRATAEKFKTAIGTHDVEAIVSFYTADGWQLPEVGNIARTADELRAFWRAVEALPIANDIVDVADRVEVARSGDLATQYGEFRQVVTDSAGNFTSVPQKFVNIWRKQPDGSWKVSASMATVSTAVSGHP